MRLYGLFLLVSNILVAGTVWTHQIDHEERGLYKSQTQAKAEQEVKYEIEWDERKCKSNTNGEFKTTQIQSSCRLFGNYWECRASATTHCENKDDSE